MTEGQKMLLSKVAAQMDRIAKNLSERGLDKHAHGLSLLRDIVAKQGEAPSMSKHAAKLDALAKRAHELGMGEIACELCLVRDEVQATAMDGPEGYQPVNSGEEGYPEHSKSRMVNPEGDKVIQGPQNQG